jgi:HSP20 family protein
MFPVRRRDYRRLMPNPFELMQRDLGRVFGYWPELATETADLTGEYPMDMREEDNKIIVEQEVPGFKSEEIDVSVEGDVLHISAERRTPETKGTSHLRERCYTRVQRSVTLPSAVDESKVDARLEGGVLRLEMPKAKGQQRRRIQIK